MFTSAPGGVQPVSVCLLKCLLFSAFFHPSIYSSTHLSECWIKRIQGHCCWHITCVSQLREMKVRAVHPLLPVGAESSHAGVRPVDRAKVNDPGCVEGTRLWTKLCGLWEMSEGRVQAV